MLDTNQSPSNVTNRVPEPQDGDGQTSVTADTHQSTSDVKTEVTDPILG